MLDYCHDLFVLSGLNVSVPHASVLNCLRSVELLLEHRSALMSDPATLICHQI